MEKIEEDSTWSGWFERQKYVQSDIFPPVLCEREWCPSESDRRAAWLLYTELRTRITTQPLHYLDGDELSALESLYQLFGIVRGLVKDEALVGATHFSELTIYFVNKVLRPFTAKWHSHSLNGQLLNHDIKTEFRAELIALQREVRKFSVLIGALARGDESLSPEGQSDIDEWTDEVKERMHHDADVPLDKLAPLYTSRDMPVNKAVSVNKSGAVSLEEVLASERLALLERRDMFECEFNDITALAISGGGIRSATLALGVLQRLGETGLLKQVDYLSTVSGGGYIGSLISRYLNESPEEKKKLADIPTNKNVSVGLGSADEPLGINSEISPVLQHLRNNSKYLLQDLLRPVTQVLYGIAVQLLVVVSLVIMLALFVYGVDSIVVMTLLKVSSNYKGGWYFYVLAGLTAFWVILLVFLPVALTSLRVRAERWETTTFTVGVITALLWILYFAVWVFDKVPLNDTYLLILTANILIIGLPLLIAIIGLVMSNHAGAVLIRFSVFLFSTLLFLATTLVTIYLVANPELVWKLLTRNVVVTLIAIFAMVVILLFLDVNKITLHRYYRNRLSRAYLIKRGFDDPIDPEPADQKVSDLRACAAIPYHLINTTINGPHSKGSSSSPRGMGYFLFSEKYTGCEELGYYPTKDMESANRDVTLGTAMAISGAAVSPQMGNNAAGFAGKLLSLANIRMNYWLRNPVANGVFKQPGLVYLFKEYLNLTTMNDDYVYLSDGGHIENLALFELFRRRCRYIIAIDGEADSLMTRAAINRIIRLARQDLQIELKIDTSRLALNENHVSHSHFAFGTIHYPDGFVGHLLYFKSSLTGNEPADVLDYKRRNPSFPHQSTADQFFDEEQFEAYRALGYHMCEEIFANELVGSHEPEKDLEVSRLFKGLIRRLLH